MHECLECGYKFKRGTVVSVGSVNKGFKTGRYCPKCNTFIKKIPYKNTYKQRIANLERENFILAAGQCIVKNGLLGGAGGSPYCDFERKLVVCVEALENIVEEYCGDGSLNTFKVLGLARKALKEINNE